MITTSGHSSAVQILITVVISNSSPACLDKLVHGACVAPPCTMHGLYRLRGNSKISQLSKSKYGAACEGIIYVLGNAHIFIWCVLLNGLTPDLHRAKATYVQYKRLPFHPPCDWTERSACGRASSDVRACVSGRFLICPLPTRPRALQSLFARSRANLCWVP